MTPGTWVRFRDGAGEIREGWVTREWPEHNSIGVSVLDDPRDHEGREVVVHRENILHG